MIVYFNVLVRCSKCQEFLDGAKGADWYGAGVICVPPHRCRPPIDAEWKKPKPKKKVKK